MLVSFPRDLGVDVWMEDKLVIFAVLKDIRWHSNYMFKKISRKFRQGWFFLAEPTEEALKGLKQKLQ